MATAPVPSSPYAHMTLREIVRDVLGHGSEPDTHKIADEVYDLLTAAQVTDAALLGLSHLVADEVRTQRAKAFTKPQPSSSKWPKAAKAAKARPDVFGAWVWVGNDADGRPVRRLLGECGRSDLIEAERLLREQGAALIDRAGRYAAIRKRLRGKALVSSLPRKTVEAILDA
jgi:hypothetical protein